MTTAVKYSNCHGIESGLERAKSQLENNETKLTVNAENGQFLSGFAAHPDQL